MGWKFPSDSFRFIVAVKKKSQRAHYAASDCVDSYEPGVRGGTVPLCYPISGKEYAIRAQGRRSEAILSCSLFYGGIQEQRLLL